MALAEPFDCEALIAEVEKRPALFNSKVKEYNDRYLKEKLWLEVCEAVVGEWNRLTEEGKSVKVRQIQRRWKSLRDCFRRELHLQKKRPRGSEARKRKYIYYDQLVFLMNSMEERDPADAHDALVSDDFEDVFPDVCETILTYPETSSLFPKERKGKTNAKKDFEEELLEILREKSRAAQDEDQTFLMSLMPAFKRFNEEQKYVAKIEILHTMRQVQMMSPVRDPSKSLSVPLQLSAQYLSQNLDCSQFHEERSCANFAASANCKNEFSPSSEYAREER